LRLGAGSIDRKKELVSNSAEKTNFGEKGQSEGEGGERKGAIARGQRGKGHWPDGRSVSSMRMVHEEGNGGPAAGGEKVQRLSKDREGAGKEEERGKEPREENWQQRGYPQG